MRFLNTIGIVTLTISFILASQSYHSIFYKSLEEPHASSWAFPSWVFPFLNSTFCITAISTLAAAFAGAYGAQKISERAEIEKERRLLAAQGRAVMLEVFSILTIVKTRQIEHIYPSVKAYAEEQKDLLQAWATKDVQQPFLPKYPGEHFRKWFNIVTPIASLEERLSNHTIGNGKIFLLVSDLRYCIENLNSSFERRNDFIDDVNKSGDWRVYYGVVSESGGKNSFYPTLLSNIVKLSEQIEILCTIMLGNLEEFRVNLITSAENKKRFEVTVNDSKELFMTAEENAKYAATPSISVYPLGKLV